MRRLRSANEVRGLSPRRPSFPWGSGAAREGGIVATVSSSRFFVVSRWSLSRRKTGPLCRIMEAGRASRNQWKPSRWCEELGTIFFDGGPGAASVADGLHGMVHHSLERGVRTQKHQPAGVDMFLLHLGRSFVSKGVVGVVGVFWACYRFGILGVVFEIWN